MTICSTLSGKVAVKHPKLGTLIRDDGAVFVKCRGKQKHHDYHWTFGSPSRGYRIVEIDDKKYRVHRLIAEAFIPNPENKPYVDHINRNKADNRVVNLRWVTPKENNENSSTVYNRKYQSRRCDDPKAYNREWRNANLERAREKSRRSNKKRRQEHGDEERAKARKYYAEHREHYCELQRKYNAAKKHQKAAQ